MNDKTTIQPLFNYILIERDQEKEITKGNIFIPDSSKEKPSTGTVISIGNGVYNEHTSTFTPLTVKIGDKVIFNKHSGQTIVLDEDEKFLIKEQDILGIIK